MRGGCGTRGVELNGFSQLGVFEQAADSGLEVLLLDGRADATLGCRPLGLVVFEAAEEVFSH